jgi:Type II secretory pathway, prepilin signal peptidase PulO and related peptidases
MIRELVTVFAGLLGLAFGSFLNVCVSRWPEGESIVLPRSHCRNCENKLRWWENIPLLSWALLHARCRTCRVRISGRYPLVELTVGALWAYTAWQAAGMQVSPATAVFYAFSLFVFYWMLVALAALDAEHLWLPNALTIPGIVLGLAYFTIYLLVRSREVLEYYGATALRGRMLMQLVGERLLAVVAAAGVLLLIRWLYGLIRHREGMGLGDVKLIAMIAAWLGLPGTLVAFFISAMLGAVAGIAVIVAPSRRESGEDWATAKLPFGTFLCAGGIVSSLWGQPIIAAYLRMAGF